MDEVTNVLVLGIGGQGVMTAAEIIATCAVAQGYDAKKTEVAGMAQRGGVVTSHVRFGKKVLSPVIVEGEADIMLGFEAAEAMRWGNHLRASGVALVNDFKVPPPVVTIGLYDYPEDPIGQLRAAGVDVRAFDAAGIARELGNLRLVNTVMLGAVSDFLPFPPEVLKAQIVDRFRARKPEVVAVNERAFEAGRDAQQAAARTAHA